MKNAIAIIIGIGLTYLFCTVLVYSVSQNDKVECYKLQRYSEEFKNAGFYITNWEKEMCDYHQIPIQAVVK